MKNNASYKSNKYYTVEDIHNDLQKWSESNHSMTTLEVIGQSIENRKIYAVKIGTCTKQTTPNILIIGNLHARETYTSLLCMKQIEDILAFYHTMYYGQYNLHTLLSNINIWFIPLANPDGLAIVQEEGNFRWKANANGVDLNRNYDDGLWDIINSPSTKSSEKYKGDFPNSEPETKAIQKFCRKINPILSASYHSYGNVLYWADTCTHNYFRGLDRTIATRISGLTGYRLMPISQDPKSFGCGFENWFRKEYKRVSICVEISPVPTTSYRRDPYKIFYSHVYNHTKFLALELARLGLEYV